MPKACACCTHPKRDAINHELVRGTPNLRISKRYGMSDTAVRNHRQKHLPETLVKAAELAEIDYSKDLVQQAHQIQKDALAVLESAKAAGNLGGVLQAIDRAQKGIALLAGVIEKLGGTEDREIVFSWQESVCPKCGGREGLASAPFPQADGRPTRA